MITPGTIVFLYWYTCTLIYFYININIIDYEYMDLDDMIMGNLLVYVACSLGCTLLYILLAHTTILSNYAPNCKC